MFLTETGARLAVSTFFARVTQDVKGEDAEETAARKEGLRAKMMEKSRDGQRWGLVFFIRSFAKRGARPDWLPRAQKIS